MHNEKSLKPLAQIDLMDRKALLFVHVQNNGVGPLIIDKITFIKNGVEYSNIEQCLTLDPRSYQHVTVGDDVSKVILPGTYLEVFSTTDDLDTRQYIREQLALIKIKVDGRDIYANGIAIERKLHWFVRHQTL